MNNKILCVVLAAAVSVSGCSSTPRAFAPTLSAPPADQRAFDQATAECSSLLVAGKLDQNGRLASAGVGVAAGAATMAAGASAATAAGLAGGMAIASATVFLIPVAMLGGAIGMAKIKRGNKEQAIKTVMTGCLKERGYAVNGWTRLSKADIARARAATPAVIVPAAAPPASN